MNSITSRTVGATNPASFVSTDHIVRFSFKRPQRRHSDGTLMGSTSSINAG